MTSGSPEGSEASTDPGDSPYRRFWRRRDAIYWVFVLGLLLEIVLFSRLRNDDHAEAIQHLQAGQSQYVLYFHRIARSYNSVEKDGRRVFDNRDGHVGLCLRLHASASGRIEAECHHNRRRETVRVELP